MLRVLDQFSGIILSYKVTRFEQFGQFFKLRVEVELIDHSRLFIRETVLDETNRKYAYHWQYQNGKLLIRWDNAPDWELKTFPHHKHIGKEDHVEPSCERTLEQVMPILVKMLEKSQD